MSTDHSPKNLHDDYIELYKLTVEMADRVTARRGAANSFFLALNTGLAALAGAIEKPDDWLGPAAGIVLCLAWWLLLRSYRDLNRAKFRVINDMEARLSIKPFADEWRHLKDNEPPWWRSRYAEQGTVERFIPFVFIGLYTAVLLGATA